MYCKYVAYVYREVSNVGYVLLIPLTGSMDPAVVKFVKSLATLLICQVDINITAKNTMYFEWAWKELSLKVTFLTGCLKKTK